MGTFSLSKFAYISLQQGKAVAGLMHKEVSNKMMQALIPESNSNELRLNKDLLEKLGDSLSELQEIDWDEAEQGLYPKNLLFYVPWIQIATKYPLLWVDLPSTWKRRKTKKTRDIPKSIKKEAYPEYYLQNFHYQSDGYLSEKSADLYDIQVEILFNGAADAMRRRVISPLKKGIKKFKKKKPSDIKILDIATGTGRTLQQIRSSFPEAELTGIDLSSSYLKQAAKIMNKGEGEIVQLIKGNAESLPFLDESFQAISCVFLLHELPRGARQNVLKECYRVLEPGGVLVIADSIQISDSPQFNEVMEGFYKNFHEPFYCDYIKDNINERIELAGFETQSAKSYFMTRVWEAQRPQHKC